MPSRRQLLAGGVVVAGGVACGYTGRWPVSVSGESRWPMVRHDPAGTGATEQAGPKPEPDVLWQSDGRFDGMKSPVLIGETLVASGDQSVVALDCETGERRYERSGSYRMSPVFARADAYRSDVVVTGNEHGFAGLATSGGFALGEFSLGYERWQRTATRSKQWQFTAARRASAVAAEGTIYATVPNTNRVVAIDANSGRIEWRHRVGTESDRELNRPAVRDGTVYVTSSVDHVVALDADTGQREWQTTIETLEREETISDTQPNAPTVTEAGLVVPMSNFVDLRSLDDGSRTWRYVHDGNNKTASVSVSGGTVVLTDGEQSLFGVSLDGGDKLWQSEYHPDTDPVVADSIVYLSYYWLPELRAFDAATGEPLWTVEIPHAPSQPIVADGRLYVSTFDGVLALGEER